MNNNRLDIDAYTRKLVKLGGEENPTPNFTKNVMGQILKDPAVNVSFITKDDKKSNWWLFISVGVMILGYVIFYFIKNGFSFNIESGSVESPGYIKAFVDFFSNLFAELSLSPFILLALVGVLLLVLLDKTIVKYLYSI